MKKRLLFLAAICFSVVTCSIWASTTFTTSKHSYYGRESKVEKLTVVVVPVHREDVNDHNDVNSVAASDEAVYGDLRRITIDATGDDTDFIVNVRDADGITLFSKTDCNTAGLPVSYGLSFVAADGNSFPGIYVAGPLTVETNDVNAVDLSAINVTLYFLNP